jgi:hypothetical protein
MTSALKASAKSLKVQKELIKLGSKLVTVLPYPLSVLKFCTVFWGILKNLAQILFMPAPER